MDGKFVCPPHCAQCCGLLIFKLDWWEQHKHLALELEEAKVFDDLVVPTRSGKGCVFLNPQKRCVVYEDRPDICRRYGIDPKFPCPILRPDGTHRSNAEKRQVKAIIDEQVNGFLAYARSIQR